MSKRTWMLKMSLLIISLLVTAVSSSGPWQPAATAGNEVSSAAYQTADGWQIEVVTDVYSGVFYRPSLALDSQGYPHLSFIKGEVGNDLAYAHKTSTGWYVITIDTSVNVWATSLALDSDDQPHIGYAPAGSELRYAYKDTLGWHTESVENSGVDCFYPSLALDENDSPHMSFYDEGAHELKYAYRDSQGWHIETVVPVSDVGENTSLRLDQYGHPRIGFYDAAKLQLLFAYQDDAGWHTKVIDEMKSNLATGVISLALDHRDRPQFSYHNDYWNGLKYARLIGNSFWIQTVKSPDRIGYINSLVLDPQDRPIISYTNYDDWGFGIAYRDCSGWQTESIEAFSGWPSFSLPIAVSDSGVVHVGYAGDGGYALKLATKQLPDLPVGCVYLPMVEKPFPIFIQPGIYPVNRCETGPLKIRDGTVVGMLQECVPGVEVRQNGFMQFNFSWTVHLDEIPYLTKYPDTGNTNMYVTDNVGNRYDHVAVGGDADDTIVMYDGDTIAGWFLFLPAKSGASSFKFYDDDQDIDIDDIDLDQ